ncbi:MAG TPA: DUF973 family protein [Thermoplasmata archaeon]|nr:DUF973 family protein [Thermoplasmata archaeon]
MAYPNPPGSAPSSPQAMNAMGSHSDIEGVGNLKVGSLLGLLVQAMFWIGFLIFYLIYSALSSTVSTFGTTGSTIPSWITVNTLYIAIGLLAGGLFIGIVTYIFFYLGFRAIKRGDPEFGAPTTLMLIGLIGYLMIAIGVVVLVGTIASAISSATAGTVSPGSAAVDLGALLGAVALAGIGAILALIGVIGLVLGNWRSGTRYGESTLKIGAILTILPFVSIVGYILLLVGYSKAGTKLRSGWAPPRMGYAAPFPGAPGYAPPMGGSPPPYQPPPPPPPS